MSLASVRDIAAVHELAEPWLRISSYKPARDSGGIYPGGPYSFEAEVKVDPDEPLGAEFGTARAAHAVRSHLMSRTEEALDALSAAGWYLTECPRMEFTGSLVRFPLDDDGRPTKPPLWCNVLLKLWFEVDRAYSPAERAMDPDVIAGEIFATWERGERPWNG
jgi:hypothetical protein